jgi:hypothetical protein
MKKQILLTLALASWWTSLLLGQSPPPPPTPTIQAQDQQDLSASKQGNSATAPSPTVSAVQHDVSAKDKDKENGQRSTNSRIDVLAWVVALAAVAQFVAAMIQATLMKKGLKAAGDAAHAAKASAKAAQDGIENARASAARTDRAIVLIDNIAYGPKTYEISGIELKTRVIFTLKNFGRTMANNVNLHGGLIPTFRAKDVLNVEKLLPTTIAPQGANSWTVPALQNLLKPEEADSINQSRGELAFHITATYEDAFGKYKYQCTGRFDPVLKRFLITGSISD